MRPRAIAFKVGKAHFRMGGRAVEYTGLENRQRGDPFVGSNPTPSANQSRKRLNPCMPLIKTWPNGHELLYFPKANFYVISGRIVGVAPP
jgi:hypothetical protein